mmetsp:Transcript_13572/g.46604  ORF Transcript_13572/g.46604 Transcript_13572/m.46604 type:complete len:227 (-) Transcript_13572:17-697(-)
MLRRGLGLLEQADRLLLGRLRGPGVLRLQPRVELAVPRRRLGLAPHEEEHGLVVEGRAAVERVEVLPALGLDGLRERAAVLLELLLRPALDVVGLARAVVVDGRLRAVLARAHVLERGEAADVGEHGLDARVRLDVDRADAHAAALELLRGDLHLRRELLAVAAPGRVEHDEVGLLAELRRPVGLAELRDVAIALAAAAEHVVVARPGHGRGQRDEGDAEHGRGAV